MRWRVNADPLAGAVALAGAALWHMLGTWWAVPLTVMLGFGITFLFMALHETAHQTAFRARAANYVLGHLAGILQPSTSTGRRLSR